MALAEGCPRHRRSRRAHTARDVPERHASGAPRAKLLGCADQRRSGQSGAGPPTATGVMIATTAATESPRAAPMPATELTAVTAAVTGACVRPLAATTRSPTSAPAARHARTAMLAALRASRGDQARCAPMDARATEWARIGGARGE